MKGHNRRQICEQVKVVFINPKCNNFHHTDKFSNKLRLRWGIEEFEAYDGNQHTNMHVWVTNVWVHRLHRFFQFIRQFLAFLAVNTI